MRDLIVALFILAALPVSFKRPMAGLLVFSLLAYMRVQDLAWGFARYQRWSLYVAMLMFAGLLFQREKHWPEWNIRTCLLIFMPVWMFIGLVESRGLLYAVTLNGYVEYVKIIVIAFFTLMVVRRREHLRAMMWVIGGSFAFFGLKNGAAAVATGGNLYINRGPGGMLEDNNDFALALAMSMPVLIGLATAETNQYYKKWLQICTPLTLMSVLATRSRGGLLSAIVATFVIVWRSRNRIAGLSVMLLAGMAAVIWFSEAGMFKRVGTLQNVQEDGSATGRLAAWKVAGKMIKDQPIFGVGYQQFQNSYLDYGARVDSRADGTRVAHNAYLQIWSENGTPVFLCYFFLLASSVFATQKLRREANRVYERSWIQSYCTAFEGAILTFMLGSTFLNRANFDLIYHYFALVMVLERVAYAEMKNPLGVTGAVRRGVGGQLSRTHQPGFRRQAQVAGGFRTTDLSPRTYRGGGGSSLADHQPT